MEEGSGQLHCELKVESQESKKEMPACQRLFGRRTQAKAARPLADMRESMRQQRARGGPGMSELFRIAYIYYLM